MRIGVLERDGGLSAYAVEILSAWGLCGGSALSAGEVAGLDPADVPVLVVPAAAGRPRAHSGKKGTGGAGARTSGGSTGRLTEGLLEYARRGGALVTVLPDEELAREAGIEQTGETQSPQRLRLTGPPMAALAGESLPVVGNTRRWRRIGEAELLAVLYPPGRNCGESPGIVRRRVGRGQVVALAFDLMRAVLLLRQGDPARAETRGREDGPARPTHLACDVGPDEPRWIPYADLLGLLLVDLVAAAFPGPVPRLWHLPHGAPGILLYSGDEDGAQVEWNRTELAAVSAAGGRMNMFIIPGNTHSTGDDVAAYRRAHDVGPHPNIRALDGAPVAARVAQMEAQIRQFEGTFKVRARSLRNHCVAWAGYLEPVEGLARCGVEMDANYFCSTFLKSRDYAPYGAFGAALPLRFCHPDGRLLPVHQQHTHTMDDVYFGPEQVEYSYHLSPAQWEATLGHVLDDVVRRFHVPHAVCIHPSNWVRFSQPQGTALLSQAGERNLPVWSFDQWLDFWRARGSWRWESLSWDGARLAVDLAGEQPADGLHLSVPEAWQGRALSRVTVDGAPQAGLRGLRHGRPVRLVALGEDTYVHVAATYG